MGEREGNEKFCLFIPVGLKEFFYIPVKSYDMGPPALLHIREEGVLRIFIPLKNPSLWPGIEPSILGPVASTLTTTPTKASHASKVTTKI
jgi:hypothetical protein